MAKRKPDHVAALDALPDDASFDDMLAAVGIEVQPDEAPEPLPVAEPARPAKPEPQPAPATPAAPVCAYAADVPLVARVGCPWERGRSAALGQVYRCARCGAERAR